MAKQSELLALAKLRQRTRYPSYNCIGDYHAGAYECDFVSPYTKTAGNIDAEIMVMLQDWASDEFLSGPFHEPSARGRWKDKHDQEEHRAAIEGRR